MTCPNQELNKKDCICPSTDCARYGVCCECVKYHRQKGNIPNCFKKK